MADMRSGRGVGAACKIKQLIRKRYVILCECNIHVSTHKMLLSTFYNELQSPFVSSKHEKADVTGPKPKAVPTFCRFY
jgi:hypothetical protein